MLLLDGGPRCSCGALRDIGASRCAECHKSHRPFGTVAEPAKGGVKHDSGKPPISLIPRSAIEAEAAVLGFGAKKYAAHNWRKGFDWSRLIDAAQRHMLAFADGEDADPESGLSHLAHARCCLAFLIEHQQKSLGTDDRYKAPTV